jgi:cell division protein FtsI (penicillin-binding protein 3)
MTETGYRKRLLLLSGALLLGALGIAVRLTLVQALGSEAYRVRARDQHEGKVQIEARRGTITDRNGRELAVSIETRSAYVHPCQIPDTAVKERIVKAVSGAIGRPPYEIRALIDNPKNAKFVFLKRRMAPREFSALEAAVNAQKLPAIGWMNDTRRFYPRGAMAAHLLGFVDIDGKGQAGVERAFDDVVRGEPTTFLSLVDARQRPLLMRATDSGRSGQDLSLTIDETIQNLADTELDSAMASTSARAGTIIVMDPATGEILALANRPGFDPNVPGASPGSSRENIAVSYGYEPGSTFKVLTAAAALEEGRARPTDLFDCGMGSITLYGRRIGDHHSYATLSLTQVIAKSSNVGIIRVGQRLPEATFCAWVKKFGFGRKTGIALPSEAPGLLQVPGGRTWSGLSQPMMSMGQSIVVTPLQMLTAIATIGAGGERHTPRIVRAVIGSDGTETEPEVPDPVRVLSRTTAQTLVRMMETVLEDGGTGVAASIPGYRVAGKTGTAQKVVNGVYSHTAHVASFVGFVPSENPALAAIVVLDEPQGRYYGGDVAAPTFARVVGPALAYLRVPPTEAITPPRPTPEALRAKAERLARRRARIEKAALVKAREAAESDEPPAPLRSFPASWQGTFETRRGIVPDLYGWDLRDSLTALARSGCRARTTGSGFVVSQAPAAGSPLAAGQICTLVLAPEPAGQDEGQGM